MTSLAVALGAGLGLGAAACGVASAQQPIMPPAVDWHPAPAEIVQVQFKPGGQSVVPPVPPVQIGPPSQIGTPRSTRIRQADETTEFLIRTETPGLDQLTQRLSEKQLQRLLMEENRQQPGSGPIYFPDEEPVSTKPYTQRQYPARVHYVEPAYVSHGQLYFEQKNFERYGWSFGPFDPAVQLATFWYDLAFLPYHIGANACHCYDTSAGKCLPGDPVPLLLYQERFSVTGAVFEAGTILGGLFIFP